MVYIFIGILIVSVILAWRSMKDLGFADDVRKLLFKKKMKGSIVFFEDKVVHYSSNSSSASSSKGTSTSEK